MEWNLVFNDYGNVLKFLNMLKRFQHRMRSEHLKISIKSNELEQKHYQLLTYL